MKILFSFSVPLGVISRFFVIEMTLIGDIILGNTNGARPRGAGRWTNSRVARVSSWPRATTRDVSDRFAFLLVCIGDVRRSA